MPEAFAQDPDRRARFEREARLLATLNHPNIAGVYGLHVVPSTDSSEDNLVFIAMELVPGEDLAVRLARGPLSVEDAIDVARQVAQGLEAAHDQGVIHRDLKPANIKRTPEGNIKVLDLGLAKALANENSVDSASLSLSPTITAGGTLAGTLLGTAAYMSPEQVKGKEADRRADIWAFGCVLFEMLTGRTTFGGETISEVMASVLRDRPEEDALPAETPAGVRSLLSRCLDPDRNTRLRDMGEARIALSPEVLASATVGESAAESPPGRKRERLAWIAATAILAVAALTGWFVTDRAATAPADAEVRASILPPEGHRFGTGSNSAGGLSISPDGTKMTFEASVGSGRSALYLRSLGAEVAQKLAGTEGATYPIWSPDSQQIAFFADGRLKKLDLGGGAPLTVAPASDGRGGTWNTDGTILFAPDTQDSIHRVSVGGLLGEPVTQLDNSRGGETTHRFPSFLPDGRHFLYLRGSHSAANQDDVNSIWVGDIESDSTFELLQSGSQASYAQGHIFWVRDLFLMARPFSTESLAFTGDAFAVGEGVVTATATWIAAFATSDSGPLAFHGGSAAEETLNVFDREGNVLGKIGEEPVYGRIRLSHDGRHLAATIADAGTGRSDLWIYDMARNVGSRLTFHDAQDSSPIWSPDGNRIAYCARDFVLPWQGGLGSNELRIADLESGEIEKLYRDGFQPSWSPSGWRIAFLGFPTQGQRDIGTIAVKGGEPVWITNDPELDWSPQWAPDGHFLYFASNRGGAHNIWRVAIDQETGEVLGDFLDITTGGTELQGFLSIAANGLSIVYAGRQNISNLMAAPYDAGTATITGPPAAITTGPRDLNLFDISPDGQWIAYTRSSPWEDIVLMRADGSEERKLTDDPYNDRRPRFSPDGEQIYFYSNSDGANRVWSIHPDGTGRTLITSTDEGFMFTDPSPDGKTMSTNTDEGGELFSLTESYSAETTWRFPQDSQGRMFAPLDWSSDGQRILGSFYSPGAPDSVTAIYNLDSKTYEKAGVGVFGEAFLGDDDHLVWADGSKVMMHDLRTDETRELLSVAPDRARGPMLSPDGTTLYFLQQSASADIHHLVAQDPG